MSVNKADFVTGDHYSWEAGVETPDMITFQTKPNIEIDTNAEIYFEDGIGGPIVASVTAKRLMEFLVEKGVARRVEDKEVCR